MKSTIALTIVAGALLVSSCQRSENHEAADSSATGQSVTTVGSASPVDRGAYLVTAGGCGDCHTPWTMQNGIPGPDQSKLLSGHPEGMKLPPPPKLEMPWGWVGSMSMTAFAGPWGVSYARNLTPDSTGLGNWTEAKFLEAMNTGVVDGHPLLPPMPWPSIAKLTEEDKKAIFAYLKSIPPIHNVVPPSVPNMAAVGQGKPEGH